MGKMMQKQSLNGFIVAGLLLGWVGFGLLSSPEPQQAHATPINTQAPLRVGVLEDSPPYDFYNNQNKLVGMNIEIIRAVGQRLNRPVKLEIISYNRVVMGLLFHQYDVVAAPQSISPYRRTVVQFTRPYLISSDVLVYRPEHAPINTLDDLVRQNLQVGVFNGTSYPQFLKEKRLEDHMILYPTQREMFLAFLTGKIKVMMMDEQIAHYFKDTQKIPLAMSRQSVRTHKEMAFSVRKEDAQLQAQIDTVLQGMEADGSLAAIRSHWLNGENPTVGVQTSGGPPK